MNKLAKIVSLSALIFGGIASASATSLSPGQTAQPLDLLFPSAGAVLLNSTGNTPVSFSSTSFTVNYLAFVFSDPSNVYCAGCLDFEYVFANTGPGVANEITMQNFNLFSTDVGINDGSGVDFSPATDSRSADGNTIAFNFTGANIFSPGETSSLLLIETNATQYATGSITIEDGADEAVTVSAFQPVPEPTSLALLGTGLLGAVGVIRRRFAA